MNDKSYLPITLQMNHQARGPGRKEKGSLWTSQSYKAKYRLSQWVYLAD
jgi:hypothetical protein